MTLRKIHHNKEEINRRKLAWKHGKSLGPTLLQKYLLKMAWDNGGALPAGLYTDKRTHNWMLRQGLLEQQGETLVLTRHGWDTAAEYVGNITIS